MKTAGIKHLHDKNTNAKNELAFPMFRISLRES
jgi:hypothetical protein